MFLAFFIHYKHTKLMVDNKHIRRCNGVSFYLGLLSGSGLLLVASFQVNTNNLISVQLCMYLIIQDGATLSALHYIGAILLFGLGTVYSIIVTIIGWHIAELNNDRWLKIVTYIRIIMCVLMLIGTITGVPVCLLVCLSVCVSVCPYSVQQYSLVYSVVILEYYFVLPPNFCTTVVL